jgi:leucyl-tRNA---protein transferase
MALPGPDAAANYGSYSLLWRIEQTKALKLRHFYLGYWTERSPKMAYKSQFQPHQLLLDGQWVSPAPAAAP